VLCDGCGAPRDLRSFPTRRSSDLKFVHGAWITVVAMAVLYAMMRGIRRHYDTVAAELAVDPSEELTLPSKVHAIVLVSKMHKPRSEEHTSELQSRENLVCRLLLEK